MSQNGKRRITVDGHRIAYAEAGSGPPIVLVHGNPTSSHLWRHVIPQLTDFGRCLAPDLVGMGDSDKLTSSGDGDYRFADHRRWFEMWMSAVGATDDVTLVLHDWGSALGFDWARRHAGAVRGIAYMEAIVAPLSQESLDGPFAELLALLRSPAGERLVLDHNVFVEQVLASALTEVDGTALEEYRRPFTMPGEGRRPMLAWAREIPIDGEPSDVHDVVSAYATWMRTAGLPKLFVNAEPGAALTGPARDSCRRWPNQQEVTVRAGHFVPEDAGPALGEILARWLADLPNAIEEVA